MGSSLARMRVGTSSWRLRRRTWRGASTGLGGSLGGLARATLRGAAGLEGLLAAVVLCALVFLPVAEMAVRRVYAPGIPGARPIVQHLTLWITFIGAGLAAREGRLLALSTGQLFQSRGWRQAPRLFAATLGAAVTALLLHAAVELVVLERAAGGALALGIPTWAAQIVMPIGLAIVAARLIRSAGDRAWARAVAAGGLLLGLGLATVGEALEGLPTAPGLVLVIVGAVLGMPIFAVLGGAAALLFLSAGVPLAALPAESYRLAISPTLAAVPLFTLAGFLVAEGRGPERLLRVFRGLFGWLPGGTGLVVALIFAFFTMFTGGSGVTILALGGLAFHALRSDGYRPRFATGLLTSSASLGLLLPPALPLILYGIVAQVPIRDLFIGGLLPGLLLIAMASGWAVREGVRNQVPTAPFDHREALRAIVAAKWDLFLPAILLSSIFGGFATLIEAAALTAGYAFVLQVWIHRDVSVRRDLPRVLAQASVVLGGVLIILAVALGLTSYLVDAQVPMKALEWVQSRVHSPLMFLLLLNLFLLVVGCMMDMFSAIVVVAPLLAPLGLAYGIDPVHLGIIFVANLELGYLTPPVGLNLFLASYRFERPVGEVARSVLPLLALFAVAVAIITYFPWLSTGLLTRLGAP